METRDWSWVSIMLEIKLFCLYNWIIGSKYAHTVLVIYTPGQLIFVFGPGFCFGALGWGVVVWAEFGEK